MKNIKRTTLVSFVLLNVLLFTSLSLIFSFTTASASADNQLIDLINNDEILVITDQHEVYGNQKDLSPTQFEKLVQDGNNKIYLHYRTDRNIDIGYDALLCIKTSEKIYFYEFNEAERDDAEFLVAAIKSFVNLYKNKIMSLQCDDSPQKTIKSNIPTTFISCAVEREYIIRFDEKGYIAYHIAVYRYDVVANSQLFIVTVNNAFVPGSVAKTNGDNTYKSFQSLSGYVHMTAEQAFDRNEEYYYGIRYGGLPYKKDYWPINEPGLMTIMSSVQTGLTIGYSFKNGFSTDGISISSDRNIGANISFGYSKSYTQQEPALSVQPSSSNFNEAQWSFAYSKKRAETYHLQTNYMFELDDSKNSMCKGDFRLKLDYQFVLKNGILPNKSVNHSADLFVEADVYKYIGSFNNGMI